MRYFPDSDLFHTPYSPPLIQCRRQINRITSLCTFHFFKKKKKIFKKQEIYHLEIRYVLQTSETAYSQLFSVVRSLNSFDENRVKKFDQTQVGVLTWDGEL